jgi:hypothetical protein
MRALSCGERAIIAQDGPEDEEKPRFWRVREIHSARKAHPCGHCNGWSIPAGQPYLEFVEIDAGRWSRQTYCAGPCMRKLR